MYCYFRNIAIFAVFVSQFACSQEINIAPKASVFHPNGLSNEPLVVGAIYFNAMKQIKLTKGKFAMVDDDDFERLNKYNWFADKSGNTYYAKRNTYLSKGRKTTTTMHREILGLKNKDGRFVDHKDRNGLNNQKLNIRFCTKSQNCMNKKPRGYSKYLGVVFYKRDNREKRWAAHISVNKKSVFLGMFKTEKEAARAYNKAAKKHHREFANLNIV